MNQNNNTTSARVLRVACYERVSTEEQTKGLSIDAQTAALESWVHDHGHVMIGHYTDAGVSGGKPIEKRPAMWRLLHDVQAGQVDLILFTKLDRWFRSLKNYYKAQEILDGVHCAWQAIQEDYETLTASGRFKVNIMLSVAENERERTSERIHAVFDYKSARGEYLSGGNAVPLGYTLVDKHLQKDPETAPAVERFFDLILSGHSLSNASSTVCSEYEGMPSYGQWRKIAYNPIYAGIKNGTAGYCPAYITSVQHEILLNQKQTRAPKNPDSVYLFTGILVCPVCGRKMTPVCTSARGERYLYYRCQRAMIDRNCENRRGLREIRLESLLTAYVFDSAQIVADSSKAAKTTAKPAENEHTIDQQMRRLAETYTDGLIDRDTYKSKLAQLTAKREALRKAPRPRSEVPPEIAREIIEDDIRAVYDQLEPREKRRFWHSVLSSVAVQDDQITEIHFIGDVCD